MPHWLFGVRQKYPHFQISRIPRWSHDFKSRTTSEKQRLLMQRSFSRNGQQYRGLGSACSLWCNPDAQSCLHILEPRGGSSRIKVWLQSHSQASTGRGMEVKRYLPKLPDEDFYFPELKLEILYISHAKKIMLLEYTQTRSVWPPKSPLSAFLGICSPWAWFCLPSPAWAYTVILLSLHWEWLTEPMICCSSITHPSESKIKRIKEL